MAAPDLPPDVEHPKGTLAIVFVFAAIFTLGWIALYFFRFLASDVPHH